MKKFYIKLFLIMMTCINVHAQWTPQIPTNIAENRCVFMTSASEGYIAGAALNMGVILKTTNAGALWDTVSSGTIDTLRSVFFTTDSIGYVSGANGTIRKTTDAGLTWTALTSGVPNLLRSIFFVSDSVGYACGGGGAILRTVDGGNTWTSQTSGTTQDLINIRFIDPDKGYCVSSLGTFDYGIILKTIDGGNIWTPVYSDSASGFLGLAVVGDSIVYAAGGHLTIVKSTDAGATWTVVNVDPSTTASFRGASFLTADTGFVVGDSSKIFYTSDGGANWVNQYGSSPYGTLSVFFVNSDTAYACGGTGTIYRYKRPCMPGAPSAINGNSSVCSGGTEVYSISAVPNATSYTWQIPAGASIISNQGDTVITIQFGSAAGNIVVFASNICGQGPSTNLLITVLVAPPVPVITQVGGVLHSSSLVGNQWYYNGVAITGATSDNWLPLLNGTYTLIVTYTNGCVSDTSAPFIVVDAGVYELSNIISGLHIIPNPANENTDITFELKKPAIVSITVYDVLGNEVIKLAEGAITQGLHHVNMNCSGLAIGVYVLNVEVDGKNIFRKLVKE